ncbi:IS66 Orf2 like protein [compost metagenome]
MKTSIINGSEVSRLSVAIQTALKDDPMSGHVFIFRGRSGSQVKLLWSTGDGLCLHLNAAASPGRRPVMAKCS